MGMKFGRVSPPGRQRFFPSTLLWGGTAVALAFIIARLRLRMVVAVVGGAGFLILALLWPPVVLPALALSVPFGPAFPLGGFSVGTTDLLIGLIVGAWLTRHLVNRQFPGVRLPLLAPLSLYIVSLFLSLRGAWSLSAALPEWVKWLEVLALYVVVRSLLDHTQWPTWLPWPRSFTEMMVLSLIVAGVLEALLGLFQFFLRVGPPQFIILGRFLRAYGTFAQPNPYAGYLGLVLPLAVSLALDEISRHTQGGRLIWPRALEEFVPLVVYPFAAGIIGLGLLASWSRGGWLGMLAGLTVVVVLRSRRAAWMSMLLAFLLGAAVVLGIIGALPASVSARFQGVQTHWTLFLRPVELRSMKVTGENFALVERMAHWWAAYAMWLDHPWTGVGVGNYPVAYEAYRMPGWKEPLGHAHNMLLNAMAETGLVGLMAYSFLWIWAFVFGLWVLPRTRGFARAVLVGALGGLLHLTVHNLFDNLYVHGMYAYVAILLALVEVLNGHGE